MQEPKPHKPRRPAGTGSIRKRGPNSYQAIIRVTGIDGKSRQLVRAAPTMADARQALAELTILAKDYTPTPLNYTFGQLAEKWRKTQDSRSPSPASLYRYDQALNGRWVPNLYPIPLRTLSAEHLDDLYQRMAEEGMAPNTILWVHTFVKSILNQGIKWEWIRTNPAKSVSRIPKRPRTKITLPTADQLIALLDAADEWNPTFGLYLRILAATGARRGEICALQPRSINREHNTLSIHQRVVDGGKGQRNQVIPGTKSGEPRILPISAAAIAAIDKHLARIKEEFGQPLSPFGYLFDLSPRMDIETWTLTSRPADPNTMTGYWGKLRDRQGLHGVRLHDLRHLAATQLFAKGQSVPTVSKMLGHSKGSTTLNVYAQYVESGGREAAEILGDLGFGG